MRIARALKRRSVLMKLPVMGAIRCNCTAIFVLCMIGALWLIDKVILNSGQFWERYGLYMMGMLLCSLTVIAVLKYGAKSRRNKLSIFKLASNIYITVMGLLLFLMADEFLKITGSLAFYFSALVFISVVPVLKKEYFIALIVGQIAIMWAYIYGYRDNTSFILQTVTINAIMLIVNYWKYYTVLKRIELESKLNEEMHISEQDPLTKLTNRRGLERRIDAMFPLCERHKIPVGVIMIDIDQFKKYNDTYGHPQGDVCIRSISKALKNAARRTTDVIARVGGEEFVIFVQEIEKVDLLLLTKRIQNCVEELALKHAPNADFDCVTVSVGLAYGNPGDGCTFKELYSRADKELYMAKTNGRNCIGIEGKIIAKNKKTVSESMNSYDVYETKKLYVN